MKPQTYKAKDGWRWRIRARNGRIVAEGGESYVRERECVRALDRLVTGLQKLPRK